jgi:hypothetical protein
MQSGKKHKRKRLFAKMSREECVALMKRLDGGELQQTLADELGVSRQYISAEYQAYRRMGEHYRLEVPPELKKTLSPEQVDVLHRLVHSRKAPDGKEWDPRAAQWALAQEIGYRPRIAVIRRHLQKWGLWKDPKEKELFSQDYYEYIESPTYKEIERREKKWAEEQRRLAQEENARGEPVVLGEGKAASGKLVGGGGRPGDFPGGASQPPSPVLAKHGERPGKRRKGSHREKSKKRRKKKR